MFMYQSYSIKLRRIVDESIKPPEFAIRKYSFPLILSWEWDRGVLLHQREYNLDLRKTWVHRATCIIKIDVIVVPLPLYVRSLRMRKLNCLISVHYGMRLRLKQMLNINDIEESIHFNTVLASRIQL